VRVLCAYSGSFQLGDSAGMAILHGTEGLHTGSALRMLAAEIVQAAHTVFGVEGVRRLIPMLCVAAVVGVPACLWCVLAVEPGVLQGTVPSRKFVEIVEGSVDDVRAVGNALVVATGPAAVTPTMSDAVHNLVSDIISVVGLVLIW
jgi:hypothetical protein